MLSAYTTTALSCFLVVFKVISCVTTMPFNTRTISCILLHNGITWCVPLKKRRLSSAADLALIMDKSHEISHYLSQVCQNLKKKKPFQAVEDPLPVCRVHGGMTQATVWEPIFCVGRKFWQGLETLSSIFRGPCIFLRIRETYSHQD